MLKLYSFRRCPYAIRARFALMLSGIKYDLHEVSLKNKPQSMLEYSPKGTVPVLVLSDSTVIDESIDIVNWAMKQNTPLGWHYLPVDFNQLELVKILHSSFIPALNRYKYQNRYENVDVVLERQNIENFIKTLNEFLAVNDFIVTNKPSALDLLVFPFVRQLYVHDESAFLSAASDKLSSWYKWFAGHDVFNDVMKKIISLK